MVRESAISDRDILTAALVGFESQRDRIEEAIREIRSQLGIRGSRPAAAFADGMQPAPAKRRMSAAARKRIADATRKRWAEYREKKAKSHG